MDQRIELFRNILEERRQESSNFMWVSRKLNTVVSYKQYNKSSPNDHKLRVLQSAKIQDFIRKICEKENASQEEVEKQIKLILDEIGYNKRLSVIRWLGLVLTKICKQVCQGIYVNEANIMKVKSLMGHTPVIFLPSHRSYADFILMSYICFTYNIEIPAIAAGMDFHAMWGMGTMLRDTGAFFMRRSFNDDNVYWETFRQYVNQILTEGDLPIEFFIEGTRSRTGKSLTPKFGLLSMILKPFFTSQVPDILIVPINVSYDRVLEEKLFAFELLGVPKPKESTSGFFKSLSIIKENYGNIYVNFGEPISAKHYFEDSIDRSVHGMKPIYMQDLTLHEKQVTSLLAHEVVRNQQKLCVITVFNLVALSLTNNFYLNNQVFSFNDLIKDVVWLKTIFNEFGATTDLQNPEKDIDSALEVHKNLVQVNEDSTIDLVKNSVSASNMDVRKLKGHALSQQSMSFVVPFITLQIYVNPVLHYLISPASVITILMRQSGMCKDVLFGHYGFLQSLLSYEFVSNETQHNLDFEDALLHLSKLNGISISDYNYYLGNNEKLHRVLHNAIQPFIFTYYIVCKIAMNMMQPVREKVIVSMAQSQLEAIVLKSKKFVHPYCLSLDTMTNCLSKLVSMSALIKKRIEGNVIYEGSFDVLFSIVKDLEFYLDEDLMSQLALNMESKL